MINKNPAQDTVATSTAWMPSMPSMPEISRRHRHTCGRKIVEALMVAVDEIDWLQERIDEPPVILNPPAAKPDWKDCPHCANAHAMREAAIEAHDEMLRQVNAFQTENANLFKDKALLNDEIKHLNEMLAKAKKRKARR